MTHSAVVIIGAGPAGIAAAIAARESGAKVLVIDDNHAPGGQIWRGAQNAWTSRFQGIEARFNARVISATTRDIVVETPHASESISFDKLILATGARELFLPFPGWTLPKVMGAGGLQAMAKGGLDIAGKRVVVAGSGPLLLAVAAYLRSRGARITAIAEQTSRKKLNAFALSLANQPAKLWQALSLKAKLAGIPYLTDCWVTAAEGSTQMELVRLNHNGRQWTEPCDYVAIGYGLWPNTELAALLGCRLNNGFVEVDDAQQTSIPGIYCAGEPTGIGGVDRAILEGRIAGGQAAQPRKAARFAQDLETAFSLRPAVKNLAIDSTIVCRCEDVTLGDLKQHRSWRAAKLQTRCGMGPCQGRVCGPAVQTILGWQQDSIREPIFPARVESLLR